MTQFMNYTKGLIEAFANAQDEIPVIKKNQKGHNYKYADLDSCVSALKPIIRKHGLFYTTLPFIHESGLNGIRVVLFHLKSEGVMSGELLIPNAPDLRGQNVYQTQGSGITYNRRYAICIFFNLLADEDVDGRTGVTSKPVQRNVLNVKVEKPALEDDRFAEAVRMLKEGEIKLNQITDNYTMSDAQMKVIDKVIGQQLKSKKK